VTPARIYRNPKRPGTTSQIYVEIDDVDAMNERARSVGGPRKPTPVEREADAYERAVAQRQDRSIE
jgi:hypothetical protein